jgi:CPA2 family monovalent cation:H+ antiporter-2
MLLATAAIVAGKAAIAAGSARALRAALPVAAAAGLCLAQIGEFSFVIAEGARSSGLLDGDMHKLLVTATIASLLATPALVSAAARVGARWHPPHAHGEPAAPAGRGIVIVGYGPAGAQAFRDLRARRGAECTVIDSNPALVALARHEGAHAQVGDAGRAETLEHAGVPGARLVLVTMADVGTAEHVAALVRQMAPQAVVVARSRYHAVTADILRAGAHRVVDEEELVGERLAVEAEAALRAVR